MEIRRKQKKTKRGILYISIIPLCAFIVFLIILICLSGSRGGTTTLRSAEDLQYQLSNRHIYGQNNDNNKELINEYRDPGSIDKALTSFEQSRVAKLRLPRKIETIDGSLPYDIHRCPSSIPKNYPYAWSILDILKHWNPDDTKIPDTIYQGLCAIDWRDPFQRKIAVHYRKNELPFLIKNHPVAWRVADRWSDYDYLYEKLGDKDYRNEYSTNNHMMYWKLSRRRTGPPGWKPPTENVKLSYPDWYQKAKALEDDPDSSSTAEHYYFRLNGGKGGGEQSDEWLFDELTFFENNKQNDVFMVDPASARGINCRFGPRGTIAELHYDESRNIILILHGQKRYILAHPDQCINMELYPYGHPSARHSRINWSDPESWLNDGENFRNGMMNEVVLDAGDAMYLPTHWFHFIVSLSINYQCNARSGTTFEYKNYIRECGFS